jgi:hypothetical protein
MNKNIEMKYDDIGKLFEKWSSDGELVRSLFHIRSALTDNLEKCIPCENRRRYMRTERQESTSCSG